MEVTAEENQTSFFLACLLLTMVTFSHVADRSGFSGRVVRALVVAMITMASLMYFTGTFSLMSDVADLVQNNETSLRSAEGVAKFCRGIRGLAADKIMQMMVLITVLYLLLQTFCIPGTLALNAASGAVLGAFLSVPYCTILGTVGAVSCYTLSNIVGVRLVERVDRRLMKGKGLPKIRLQVNRYRADLFVYLLFIRLTPILPNWLVNMASPVVGIPLRVFVLATFLGILPQTYLSVRFGVFASTYVDGSGSIVSVWDTLLLAVLGVAVLGAFWLKKRLARTAGHSNAVWPINVVAV